MQNTEIKCHCQKSKSLKSFNSKQLAVVKIMSKILQKDKRDIIKHINLFSDIHPHAFEALNCLSTIKEERYIDAFLLLKYAIDFRKNATDIFSLSEDK